MDIGTGIAIAGVWLFAGILGASSSTNNRGMWFAIIIAAIVTLTLK